jgi:CubicO group peptidase (beta-lactamase class C family)
MIYPGLHACYSLVAALAGAGVAAEVGGAPPVHSAWEPAADDARTLRARIADIVRESGVPGAAVAVVDGSGGWTAGFGRAALEGRPMDEHTLFRVGSLSKPFISLAVMRLVEAGSLRLGDRVRDLVPEIQVDNPWEDSHPLRVEHLLEHTSGFDEMRFNEIFDPDGSQERPLRQVLAVNPRSRVVRWPPGTRWAYSQPGYTLAGYIIEKVSGLPYEQFLEEEVFRPLGIDGATLRLSPGTRPRLAIGYHRRRPAPQVMLLHRPAGNLMISAAGLGRLVQMLLGRGQMGAGGPRFLETASVERIESCGTRRDAAAPACYGLGNWGDVRGPVPMRGHGGFMPGYFSFFRYAPTHGFGYAVLVNDTASPASRRIGKAILRHLMTGIHPPPPPTAPSPLPDLDQIVGSYRLASPGVEFLRFKSDVYAGIDVRKKRGQLHVQWPDGSSVPIVATGEDHFRFPGQSGSSIRFSRSETGRRQLVVHNDTFEEQNAIRATARRWALELSLLLLFTTALVPPLLGLARTRAPSHLLLRPFLAGLCLLGAATTFDIAHDAGLLGVASVPTVTVWILTWLFALFAHTGFRRAIAGLGTRETAPLLRCYALLTSAAAVWVALHLARYGLIGLRTWRW